MSIVVAGGTINNTVVLASALSTKTALADALKNALVTAGWTATGSSGAWTVATALTAQGVIGLGAELHIDATALTNCVSLRMCAPGSVDLSATHMFLLPGLPYRFWADKHQFFAWAVGSDVPRAFAGGGVPYIVSGSAITRAVWGVCNAQSDTDTSARASWRNRLYNSAGVSYANINGTNWSGTSTTGCPDILSFLAAGQSGTNGMYWWNGHPVLHDASLSYGTAAGTAGRLVGYLWDALVIGGTYLGDSLVPLDYNPVTQAFTTTAIAVTHNNTTSNRTLVVKVT